MLYIVLIVIVLVIILFVACYNSLIVSRNKVNKEWSEIDVQLERRFDLIPNLVETVKGYEKHEEETLTKLTELRTNWNKSASVGEKVKLNDSLTNNLKSVYLVVENYPELKASDNFLQLQAELTNTEEKISMSRNSYNSAVNEYNTKIEVIPTNIIAKIFNFKKAELYEIQDDEARKNVKVSF